LEPKLGIGKKREPILFELREKSGKTDFSSVLFLLKLLLSVQTESFIEALYRLVQQTIPSFGSNYGQTPTFKGPISASKRIAPKVVKSHFMQQLYLISCRYLSQNASQQEEGPGYVQKSLLVIDPSSTSQRQRTG
jgi:hypothetical protein